MFVVLRCQLSSWTSQRCFEWTLGHSRVVYSVSQRQKARRLPGRLDPGHCHYRTAVGYHWRSKSNHGVLEAQAPSRQAKGTMRHVLHNERSWSWVCSLCAHIFALVCGMSASVRLRLCCAFSTRLSRLLSVVKEPLLVAPGATPIPPDFADFSQSVSPYLTVPEKDVYTVRL